MRTERTCGVRIYKCGPGCRPHSPTGDTGEKCRIGCFKPARFLNPNFGVDSDDDVFDHWWKYEYNYAEYLCAEHYDEVMRDKSENEEADDAGS
jgi:hypothetical protein